MRITIKQSGVVFTILFNLILFNSASFAFAATDIDSAKFVVTEDDRFNKIFREGRDLIDKEDWKKAAEKFNEIVCDCPDNKGVDAAFYWLAFCYKKQNMMKQMDETIDRLLKTFPNSSWADDARVMQIDRPAGFSTSVSGRVISGNYPADASASVLFSTASSQTPLEREDEIKLAAFQSLYSSNPKRAIEIMGEMLQSGSKASETLKREVIRTFRSSRFYPAQEYGVLTAVSSSPAKPKTDNLPQLRETLFKGYQTESSVTVKSEIIYALGNLNDDQSSAYVVQLYSSEQNKELKKAIINSFGGFSYFAIASDSKLANSKSDDLEKLLEIVRIEKDSELRRLALSNLRKFPDWSAKNGVIGLLSQMFDLENDDEFKLTIIRIFASSKENTATSKLLSIAKSDKSDKMRLEAIRSLRTSDNPEVQKFLEDLIK